MPPLLNRGGGSPNGAGDQHLSTRTVGLLTATFIEDPKLGAIGLGKLTLYTVDSTNIETLS